MSSVTDDYVGEPIACLSKTKSVTSDVLRLYRSIFFYKIGVIFSEVILQNFETLHYHGGNIKLVKKTGKLMCVADSREFTGSWAYPPKLANFRTISVIVVHRIY